LDEFERADPVGGRDDRLRAGPDGLDERRQLLFERFAVLDGRLTGAYQRAAA